MTERPGLRSLFIFIWPLIVLIAYYHHSWPHFDPGVPFLPTSWPSVEAINRMAKVIFLFFWTQAFVLLLGRSLQKRTAWRRPDTLANLLIAYGLGSGLLIGVLFLLAILGIYSSIVLVLFFLIATVGAVVANEDLFLSLKKGGGGRIFLKGGETTSTEKGLTVVIAAYIVVLFFHALTPEISQDALVYHLGLPNLWLIEHRLRLPLTYCFSGMPLNTELLYGLALSLSGDVLAKLVHFGFGLASLAAIYVIVRELASRAGALLAVVIFLAAPVIGLEFIRAATDFPVIFFELMAGYALMLALSQKSQERRWILLSGLFCGLGMGCKYPAWVVLPALMGTWVWQARRLGRILWLPLMAFVVAGPWWLKNLLLFHNPVYPFLCTVLFSPHSHLVNWDILESHAAQNFAALRTLKGLGGWLILPWTATLGTSTGGNYLGPALLSCFPVVLVFPKTAGISPWRKLVLLQWLAFSVLSYMPRFWLPAIASLAVVTGLSVAGLQVKWLRIWVASLMIGVSSLNLFWMHRYCMDLEGWKVTLGQTSRAEYMKKTRPDYEAAYYPAAVFINDHLPPETRILLLGETRSFYLTRPWIGASLFDEHPFFRWANEAADGDQLYDRLKSEGLTWVLFNPAEAALRQPYWVGQVTPHGRDVLDAFWARHVRLVFNDQQIDKHEYRADAVLAIVPALPPHAAPLPNVLGEILRQR